jgi:hypothetical protein
MEKFRKYFPEFKDCKAYLGIAGFSFSKKTLEEAAIASATAIV